MDTFLAFIVIQYLYTQLVARVTILTFRCPVCVKTFVLLGNLKRHMLNHELDAVKMETPVSRVFNDTGNIPLTKAFFQNFYSTEWCSPGWVKLTLLWAFHLST